MLETVCALYKAGVDVLAGRDVLVATPDFGGLTHGASVHRQLQLLVAAGLTPTEALRAAAGVLAKRFRMKSRGHIAVGAGADSLLFEGDSMQDIADTLNIKAV